MKPYYSESGITIYHGDCREVLPMLSPVDCVVADIPYGEVNRESSGLRNLDKGRADIETFSSGYAARHSARLAIGSVYLFCGTEQVSSIREALVAADLTTRLCIWHKSNPSPMNGDSLWLSGIECCVFGRKPKAYFARHCKTPVWHGPTEHDPVHETQKPLWLMLEIITASTPPGGTVLDFCMGSGTTLLAAKQSGCRAIGIENRERYCEIAANRLRQGVLFGPESESVA